ncbi:recombinase family protein [Methylobacterium dankookense]|uniref:Transposon gamma-delta resolvase n=1 Tax=Methylobacterium dankookense TaxID=560405 RepID=A0A564G6A8_9HYPH|nr:recombinase family protein [Methylobacterium dankookense]GJD54750.1 Transposon gamma-delta resolvase [Methylobacterium dankookense]VUF16069.1 Transposon gamma-delta resolvase [Methylobacterium dankookense]
MARIGYARCSSEDQSLDVQIARLTEEECQPIRSEKMSGASRDGRTELAAILDFIREGDELVCLRADRLGRDTRDVLNIVHELDQRGAYLTVLDPHITTRGEAGRIVLTTLAMVAEMERRFIKERQKEGIAQAKAKGIYKGGTRRVDREKVLAMHRTGKGPAAIAKALGCSRMQVYRILDACEGAQTAA